MKAIIPAHGGRLLEARRQFPGAPEPFIDLSTGINPVPYPIPDLPESAFTRLPEPEEIDALCAAAAHLYRARDPRSVVAAPGTQVLISMLPRIFPARTVAILGPTYGEYALAWRATGAEVREVDTFDALSAADVAMLCNPNNPDGNRTSPDRIAALAATMAKRNGYVVIDETFADFEGPGLSLVPNLPQSGTIVLRSFGKTFGMAGVRLGFAVTGASMADRLKSALGPWQVSGIAVRVGMVAMADYGWIAAARQRLATDVKRLDGLLQKAALSLIGGTQLFRLAEGLDAQSTFAKLGAAGILVRRFADQPTRLRFGIPGLAASWERLSAALV